MNFKKGFFRLFAVITVCYIIFMVGFVIYAVGIEGKPDLSGSIVALVFAFPIASLWGAYYATGWIIDGFKNSSTIASESRPTKMLPKKIAIFLFGFFLLGFLFGIGSFFYYEKQHSAHGTASIADFVPIENVSTGIDEKKGLGLDLSDLAPDQPPKKKKDKRIDFSDLALPSQK